MHRYPKRYPYYEDDADYTTNSPGYYQDLARKNKLIKLLAERIAHYDEELAKRFEEWDRQLEELPDELKRMFLEWVDDGTLARILAQLLLDEYATMEWVNNELDAYKKIVDDMLDDFKADMEKLKEDTMETITSYFQKSHGAIYQKKLMYADFHENGPIFEGAQRANQGMAYVKHNGVEKIFMISRVRGDSWSSDERQVITEFNLKEDGSYSRYVSHSEVLQLAHQGISAYIEDGEIVLITGGYTGGGNNAAKGYAKVYWKGSQTTNNNVVTFRLWGNTETTDHPFHYFNHGTPCVTADGKYIIIVGASTFQGGLRYCFIYDREEVEQQGKPENTEPLNSFKIDPPPYVWGNVTQDVTSDGYFIYIASGSGDPKMPNMITVYRIDGQYVGYYRVDGSIGDYTIAELEGKTDLGVPTQLEPEGLAIRGKNLLFQTTDVWMNSDKSDYKRREKVVHEITTDPRGAQPINRGWQHFESPATIHLHANPNDISVAKGDAFQVSTFDQENYELREMFGYHGSRSFQIFDVTDSGNPDHHTSISLYSNNGYGTYRSDRSHASGSGFTANLWNEDHKSGTFTINASNGTSDPYKVSLFGNEYSAFAPTSDHAIDLGSPSNQWERVFAKDGAINTSDENKKRDIETISNQLLDAWQELDYKQFRFKDSFEEKGDKARYHIGVIAQDIKRVFEKHDIDPFKYGILCYDEWEEVPEIVTEDGEIIQNYKPAGSGYSVRPDECHFLEMALMRREMEKIKEHVFGGE